MEFHRGFSRSVAPIRPAVVGAGGRPNQARPFASSISGAGPGSAPYTSTWTAGAGFRKSSRQIPMRPEDYGKRAEKYRLPTTRCGRGNTIRGWDGRFLSESCRFVNVMGGPRV
jgi:hypothetical protein